MTNPRFVLYVDWTKEFRFRLHAVNGEPILHSEGYKTKESCLGGIASVKKNAPLDERYKRKLAVNGQYIFSLHAENGEIIGASELYTTAAARDNGISAVKRDAPIAGIDDQTLVTQNRFTNV